MDILACLRDHPMPPTRVAQAANIHYPRAVKYFETLEASKLLERRVEEGHELLAITQEGLRTLEDLMRVQNLLRPDLA
jgi:predicted transcriptional regulator